MYERNTFQLRKAKRAQAAREANLPKGRVIGGPFDGQKRLADLPQPFRVLRKNMPLVPPKKRPESHFVHYRVERMPCCARACVVFVSEDTHNADAMTVAQAQEECKPLTVCKRVRGSMPQGRATNNTAAE